MPFSVSHFEVAKKLGVTSSDFHVGNLLPDINHYSHLFTKDQTHYITHEPVKVYGNVSLFVRQNIKFKNLDEKSLLFALGHVTHLVTDLTWGEVFYFPVFDRYKDEKERTRRYLATQYGILSSLFSRWDTDMSQYKQEFVALQQYKFQELTLPAPFGTITTKKLSPLLKKLIQIQFSVKSSFHFTDEELYRYEKELRQYIPENYYEIFLEKAVENIQNTFDKHEIKIPT